MKTEQNVQHVCCFMENYSQNLSPIQFNYNLDKIILSTVYIMSRTHIGNTESVHLMTISFFPSYITKQQRAVCNLLDVFVVVVMMVPAMGVGIS